MADASKDAGSSAAAAKKLERARDGAHAAREYEAEKLAVLSNMERLRALRLARDARIAEPGTQQIVQQKTKKKAAARSSAPRRTGARPRMAS